MGAVTQSIDVDRSPEATYAYATDPRRFSEWQEGVRDGAAEAAGGPAVGDLCHSTRQIGFAKRSITSRVTAADPPHTWAISGIDGPIRASVSVTVDPLAQERSRLTIAIDFAGHGLGRLLVPLVIVPSARREMPRNLTRLKQNLGAGAPEQNKQQSSPSRRVNSPPQAPQRSGCWQALSGIVSRCRAPRSGQVIGAATMITLPAVNSTGPWLVSRALRSGRPRPLRRAEGDERSSGRFSRGEGVVRPQPSSPRSARPVGRVRRRSRTCARARRAARARPCPARLGRR
jgi:Polyketide cyclase / dehydrase and lipid transport